MDQRYRRALLAMLSGLCVAVAAGCGASGDRAAGPATALQPGAAVPGAPADATQLFPGLPGIPTGSADVRQTSDVSLVSNFENGQAAISTAPVGIFVNGTGLDMGPAGINHNGWAIWRWGTFQNNNLPRELQGDFTISGQNKVWVLVADYTTQHWQVVGPTGDGAFTHTLDPGEDYISDAGNVYIALLTLDNNKLTVNTLNLLCDNDATPPSPPTGLTVTNVKARTALLKWIPPGDADLNHYVVYSGPADGFALTDVGVVTLVDNVDKALVQLSLTNLDEGTTYFLRMTSVDTAGNASPLSSTVTFTTRVNGPPEPAFLINPTNIQKDIAITFDPANTTDPDDPESALTCWWDFDNDGVNDLGPLPGLTQVQHTFTASGAVTVKLTVSDGVASASSSQTYLVGQSVETRKTGYAMGGESAEVLAADTDYATGRIAAIVQGAGTLRLIYFDGTVWQPPVDLSSVTDQRFCDVALAPGKVDVLVAYQDQGAGLHQHWTIYESDGVSLTQGLDMQVPDVGAGAAPQQSFGAAKLAVAPNGLVTVAIATSQNPASLGAPFRFYLSTMHQKADLSFSTTVEWFEQPSVKPFTVQRSDDTSYCVYTSFTYVPPGPNNKPKAKWNENGKVDLLTVTDAGSSVATQISYATTIKAQQLVSEKDPADNSHVSFALRNDNNKIYYGDNFGASNVSANQVYTPSRAPQTLLGVGPAGDNQGHFYWADLDTSDNTWIRGYDTGSAALFEPVNGAGLCSAGFGGWLNLAGTDGVYIATTEARDGEVTGYQLDGATVVQQDQIAAPIPGATVGSKSVAFITNDGQFTVLNTQQNPTALMHHSPTVGGVFTTSQIGLDTWATPDCAASGADPGDMILGSYYNVTDLLLYHFAPGDTKGTLLTKYSGVNAARLQYNPVTNQTMLVYTQTNGKALLSRIWDGVSWSGPSTIQAAGTPVIYEIVLRVRPDGQWGVAWDDSNDNVTMAETDAGVWQAPHVLSTDTIYFGIGSIGMEYNSSGDVGLAVEHSTGTTGLYYGLKLAGSNVATWTYVAHTQGFNVGSINVHFVNGTKPTVIYYDSSTGVKLAQYNGSLWTAANVPLFIKGSPLVSVVDAAGTIAVAGNDNSTGESAVGFLVQ